MTQQVHSWVYIYLGKKSKSTNPKLYKHPNVHRDIIIAKVWKQPKCPSQIKYMCIHIHAMEYYSVIKKEWHFAICSNMDGLGGHYAKWNKSDRKRQILRDITYVGICAKSLQSFLTLCYPMDCSSPDSSVHGILQARIQEWVAISFSRYHLYVASKK